MIIGENEWFILHFQDEMDTTNTESDLIGTALKNLMMESGLGGPDEGDLWCQTVWEMLTRTECMLIVS